MYTFIINLVVAGTQALFGNTVTDHQDVMEADRKLNQYIISHDVAKAESMYDSHFVLTTSSGKKKSKQDLLSEIGSADVALEVNETTEVTVRIVGETAVLTGILHQKGSYKGQPFDVLLRVTDTWIKTSSGWVILAGHATVVS